MPSTLLPNGIQIEESPGPNVSTEAIVATAQQPVPTVDQEKTVIVFATQLADATDDSASSLIFRCYRGGDMTLDQPPTGVQIGADLTAGFVLAVDADPAYQQIMVFWVDNGNQGGTYCVTAEQAGDETAFFNTATQISLLAVGS